MANWSFPINTSSDQLPFGLARIWQSAHTLGTYLYKSLLLGWRLLADLLGSFGSSPTLCVPGYSMFQVTQARCLDLWDVSQFDHRIFPKDTLVLETLFYHLRIKLLGGTAIFIIRDASQNNRIIATLYLRQLLNSTVGFISNVGVHPGYRRQKLAKWMMQTLAFPLANEMCLTKLVLNVYEPFVESFYERQGFQRYQGDAFEIETPENESPMFMELR